MPYLHEKLKIKKEDDRRVKLKDADRIKIAELYKGGGYSLGELANMYEVSRRTIQFCVYPERLKYNKQLFKERRKDGRYYDKDKWREQNKNHRRYKQKLFLQGKLVG